MYKIDYLPKIAQLEPNTFSFIPHVCYFSYLPSIAASKGQSSKTLFSTKIRGKEIATRTSTFLSHSIRILVDKKIQVCETLKLTEGFVFSSCRCLKQSVSPLLTPNWSEHFIRCGYFQICSGNNNTSLLLYA